MKTTGTCPKCGNRNIYYVPGNVMDGRCFPIKGGFLKYPSVPLDRYICAACGYVEEYISHDGLVKLKEAAENGNL